MDPQAAMIQDVLLLHLNYCPYIDICILQDVVESFALRGDFLPELREDKTHSYFKGLDEADAASVQALEANQEFLMEMCATLAPEPAIAPHGVWKAR